MRRLVNLHEGTIETPENANLGPVSLVLHSSTTWTWIPRSLRPLQRGLPMPIAALTAQGCRNSWRRCHLHQNNTSLFTIHSIMAASTPYESPKRGEFDTIKRSRFFDAFNSKENNVGVGGVCKSLNFNLPPSTARRWLKERDLLRSLGLRRTRKLIRRLRRKSKVSIANL
jgi:hypothetical protein